MYWPLTGICTAGEVNKIAVLALLIIRRRTFILLSGLIMFAPSSVHLNSPLFCVNDLVLLERKGG